MPRKNAAALEPRSAFGNRSAMPPRIATRRSAGSGPSAAPGVPPRRQRDTYPVNRASRLGSPSPAGGGSGDWCGAPATAGGLRGLGSRPAAPVVIEAAAPGPPRRAPQSADLSPARPDFMPFGLSPVSGFRIAFSTLSWPSSQPFITW